MDTVRIHRKPIIWVAGAAVFVLILVIVSVSSRTAGTRTTISGTFDVGASYAGSCLEAGRILDVHDGTPVWVFDEPGHPLASSTLVYEFSDAGEQTCHFTFKVASDSEPSWVQVGSQEKVRIVDASAPLALRVGPQS